MLRQHVWPRYHGARRVAVQQISEALEPRD